MTAPSPLRKPRRGRPRPTSAARNLAARKALITKRPPSARAPRAGGRSIAGGLTFTTRAALLGLTLCAVVLTLAYPFREYLSQHRQISQLASQVAKDKANLQQLKVAGEEAANPAYVERQARIRLHMQRPGDQVFQLPPPVVKPVGKQKAGSVQTPNLPGRSSQPWYSQLYRSTVESGK